MQTHARPDRVTQERWIVDAIAAGAVLTPGLILGDRVRILARPPHRPLAWTGKVSQIFLGAGERHPYIVKLDGIHDPEDAEGDFDASELEAIR